MACEAGAVRRTRPTARLLDETCLTSGSRLAALILLAAGILSTAHPAKAEIYAVDDDATLRNALSKAKDGDVINFAKSITLSANLPVVTANVQINGSNLTLSGNDQFRGLFVQSGTTTIN